MSNSQNKFFNARWFIAIIVILLLACASGLFILFKWFPPGPILLGSPTSVPIPLGSAATQPSAGDSGTQGEQYRMNIELSEGQPQPQPTQSLPLASGEPLSQAEVDQLLARLPALPTAPGDQAAFNRPAESLPPPRPGVTIKDAFPPLQVAPTPALAQSGALKVLRYAPEGEIPVAPFVSVTFDQPMVALGTLADLASADVPVRIEPALPGTWRWLGTRTLTFQYDSQLIDRLPKATEYRVTIPAGTKSANGGVLASPVSWTFTTPAPKVVVTYPYDAPQPLEPLFFVAFDQRVDPASVLRTIRAEAAGKSVDLVLATQAEIDQHEEVGQLAKNNLPGRWLAFRATAPFPPETGVTVTIGPGTPSAEGPLLSSEGHTYQFSTYAPLRIVEHRCAWYDDRCPPLTPFSIRFNNPIDENTFNESLLSVSPEIPGVSVNLYGNSLEITGQTRGRTTYTVTVSGQIMDVFGQKLGSDTRLTFKVGASDAVLAGPGQNFVSLDPASAKPVFSVYAINYKKLILKVYSVQPSDWPAFKEYLREWRRTDVKLNMPGSLLSEKTLNLDNPADTLSQVDIGLSEFMKGPSGQFVVIVEPPKALIETEEMRYRRFDHTVITWVQVTRLGLDAFADHTNMLAWVTDLRDGSPLSGVRISPQVGAETVTGSDGTVNMPVPSGASYISATLGDEQAILPRSMNFWGDDAWVTNSPADQLRWYVFDDRKMYRPGEEIHFKGWLRRIGGRQDGDVSLVSAASGGVSYRVTDPQGNELGSGRVDVGSLGGFDFVFSLPANANLGYAQLFLTAEGSLGGLEGAQYYHPFQIQEFRRPEFEVTARNETSGPYFAGDQAVLAVEAKYYAGGALPNAEVTWQVTTSPTNYSPPNWPDFSFGSWTPWWFIFDYGGPGESGPVGGGRVETFYGKTDASGTHYLRLNFDQQGDPAVEPRPQSVLAQPTVMDVNRQAWSSSTSLLVHPADVYIGLRSQGYFVERGAPLKIDFIVTDLDGNPVSGRPVEISAARLEWKIRSGVWSEQPVEKQTCAKTSAAQPDACIFETPIGGTYQITATVTDELGRLNQSRFTRWVSGGQRPPSRKVEQEEVTLIPDQQTYQPGDTARILVQSPFSPAEGLLTVSRSGTLYTKRFRIESGSTTLEIPIEQAYIPNLQIQVDLAGSAPRVADDGFTPLSGLPARPAYASGSLNLSIPPLQRTLALQVTPDQDKLEPGAETTLTVQLKDALGKPVADAELAVVVVDEAVLALSGYQLTDPISVFYSDRPSYLDVVYSRESLILSDPLALAQQAANQAEARDGFAAGAPMATQALLMEMPAAPAMEKSAEGESGAQGPAISVRTDFNPLAAFVPAARTGLDGSARLPIKLPDNLTRYRVMVVAVDALGRSFGTGESNITARLPLMVRPSAPRFLNFGDRFELPVVLQNQTDLPMQVSVAARAANLELSQPGLSVSVPANDRIEVRFPASTIMAGTARVQIAAVSGTYADAAVIELPVYTPATTEAFATYGVIDQGAAAQPVQYPTGVFPQYGGLEISTSSTAMQALTDAVLYLVTYPFECSEQLASRILAVASLRDVLTAFQAEGLPSPAEMQSAVDRDLLRLAGLQNDDGGFPYWRRGFESSPFNTIHVAHALARAGQKGFSVSPDMQQNALNYLRQIENYYPSWYGLQTRRVLSAYALYVRDLLGDRDAPKAEALLTEAGLENLPLEAIGWLWPVIDNAAQLDEIRLFVNNHVVETAGAANFTTSYDEQTYLLLSSDRRTDAILLDALIQDNPQSDLIPKLVNGLLAHRTKGRWGSTQENVFVLLSLDRYFNTFESQTPDFVARFWLGDTYAGESEFRGRSTEQHETVVPMSYVLSETAGGTSDLILSKDGAGRLYYRLGLRYAPTDLNLKPLDMGFIIERRYEAVDNPEDVSRDINGAWIIKAGARVRVRISMVADNRRYHVALVDPLPAGLEIVNPTLAVSGPVPQDPSGADYRYGWWWWGTWYEHQNLRDDRAEAFTSLLWDGVYEYTYIARATTPGTFVVPPAKAEEMYSPEVFGRSASDWVIIK